jgi:hypothetical protein
LAATKNTSTTLCYPDKPVRDATTPIVYIAMFGLAVAVVSILMRMAARFFIAGGFFPNIGADDICILVALVLIGGISGCAFIREHNHSIGMAGSSLTSQQLQTTVLEKISGPSRTAPSRHFYTLVQHGRASY